MKRNSKIQGVVIAGVVLSWISRMEGAAILQSLKKGEDKDKAWAVMEFNEPVEWIGVSQTDSNTMCLYFNGSAGDHEGAVLLLNSPLNRQVSIHQISRSPSIMRADIRVDGDIPLAALKRDRHLVVAFNDPRLVEGVSTGQQTQGVPIPGRLLDVATIVQDQFATTTFHFNGNYQLVGFVRPTRDAAALFIHGARLGTESEFIYDSPLKKILFFPEAGDILKAVLFFEPSVTFSIANRDRNLIVQTDDPLFREGLALSGEVQGQTNAQGSRDIQTASTAAIPAASVSDLEIDDLLATAQKPAGTSVPVTEPAKTAIQSSQQIPAKTGQIQEKEEPEQKDLIPWNKIITLFEFRATPIKEVLRTVANSYDLNVVIADGVEGAVTMTLRNVTLQQALNKIVHTHNCEYVVDENIITIRPANAVLSGGSFTKVYNLKYAEAENLAKIVRRMVGNDSLVQVFHPEFLTFGESGKNRIAYNKVAVQGIRRSSTLVVTAQPDKIQEVDRVIRELDRQPVQITIKSQLVEASPNSSNKLGIDWDKTITAMLHRQIPLEDGKTFTNYSMKDETPGKGGGFNIATLTASEYKAVLDFLQENTDSKLKSNPTLTAMDNEESSISVGTTVPVPKIQRGLGGQGDMVTFDYKEVNIQLNVTPHVTPDGDITMYVNPVIEEITDWVYYDQNRAPVTAKRTVNSIVTVRNGETLAIGGLIKTHEALTTKKVWLLGSLPLIGKLFQHRIMEEKQTDLMIFITPTII